MTKRIGLLVLVLVTALAGCGGGGSSSALPIPNNNDKLSGAYIVTLGTSTGMSFYMVLNGRGTMTQVGVPSPLNPPGTYNVTTSDNFSITITNPLDGNIILTGALTSLQTFSFTARQGANNWGTGTIEKVTNLAECSDTWTGTLVEDGSVGGRTHALTSVVTDATGAITGGSITLQAGIPENVYDRGLFCTSTKMAGLLVTNAPENAYKMVMIWGDYNAGPSKSISNGQFESDGNEFGTLAFTGL